MQNQPNKLFRKEALDSLSSPEQLDKLMQVVSPQAWLPLVTLGSLVVVAGVWSAFGRIPIAVTGSGVLIRPRQVVQFQAPIAGQLLNINVKAGDVVKQGQILATIDQSQLKQQLQQEQAKLAELQKQYQDSDTLQQQQIALEQRTLQQQRADLEASLRREQLAPLVREKTLASLEQKRKSLEETLRREQLAPSLRQENIGAIAQKRQSIELRKQQINALLQTRKERAEKLRRLFDEQVISQELLLQAQQEYFDAQTQLSDMETQLKELDVQTINTERDYRQNLNRIDEIKINLQEIEVQVANTERDYQQSLNKIDEIKTALQEIEVQATNAERDYQESQNKIDQIKTQSKDLDTQETKLAQDNLERINDRTNKIREVKTRIEQIELQLAKESKIVSPSNGKLLEFSVIPGQIVNAGTRLGAIEAENSQAKLTSLIYFSDKDGKQIKPGMSVQVTPSVVKRDRYGGIVGVVTNVSPFPVTTQEITAIVGNEDLAKSLAKQGEVRVQIFAELQEDSTTISGYKWSSSQGPSLKLSSGTTTMVRVKVGEVAPISYLIPILRNWTGIY